MSVSSVFTNASLLLRQWMQPCFGDVASNNSTNTKSSTTSSSSVMQSTAYASESTQDLLCNHPNNVSKLPDPIDIMTIPPVAHSPIDQSPPHSPVSSKRAMSSKPAFVLSPAPPPKRKMSTTPYPTLIAPTTALPPPPITPPPTPGRLTRPVTYTPLSLPLRMPASSPSSSSCVAPFSKILVPSSPASSYQPPSSVPSLVHTPARSRSLSSMESSENTWSPACASSQMHSTCIPRVSPLFVEDPKTIRQKRRSTYSGADSLSYEKTVSRRTSADLTGMARQIGFMSREESQLIEGSLTHAMLEVMLKYNDDPASNAIAC
ncbi:hypothetical protein BDF22DRAFT_652214 [Syncephalis plumigaleata]|nr:hypothetical protein BDF22DRAFT_652214 [Syncephalis plumigaleata]